MIIWYIYRLESWIVLHCYTEVTKVDVYRSSAGNSCVCICQWCQLHSFKKVHLNEGHWHQLTNQIPTPSHACPLQVIWTEHLGSHTAEAALFPEARSSGCWKGHGNWAQKNWNPSKMVTISNCFCPGKSFQCTLLSYMSYICKYMAI